MEYTKQENDFEEKRKENIQKNQEEFKKLFPEEFFIQSKKEKIVHQHKRSKQYVPITHTKHAVVTPRASLKRNCKSAWKRQREHVSDEDTYEDEDPNTDSSNANSTAVLIKFPGWNKRFKRSAGSNDCSDGEDYTIVRSPKKRKAVVYRPLDAVTEEDLILVAERTSDKQYDQVDGTSCHQCRQKTIDLKTVCRSGNCIGIRGQFCGPCLKNRYGESAKEAIMNPDWVCPPCRGICNCSFCMKKRGRRATGILIHHAKQSGYDNVSSYLGLTEKVSN